MHKGSAGIIPASHPRAESLHIREMLADGFAAGVVTKEGLMAHGRGEAFDYLLGEKTTPHGAACNQGSSCMPAAGRQAGNLSQWKLCGPLCKADSQAGPGPPIAR